MANLATTRKAGSSNELPSSFHIQDEMILNVDDSLEVPPYDEDDNDEDDNDEDDNDEDEWSDMDRARLAYLRRYEQMVQQQDAEDHATTVYLLPLFDRLRTLGGSDEDESKLGGKTHLRKGNTNPISYDALHDKVSTATTSSTTYTTNTERPNLLSYEAMKKALHVLQHTSSGKREVLCVDTQLMLVLKELSSSHDKNYHERMYGNIGKHALSLLLGEGNTNRQSLNANYDKNNIYAMARTRALSFPEFLHCYKTVINGMTTMQTTSTPNLNYYKDKERMYQRERTKDRSLAMLHTFSEPKIRKNTSQKDQKLSQKQRLPYGFLFALLFLIFLLYKYVFVDLILEASSPVEMSSILTPAPSSHNYSQWLNENKFIPVDKYTTLQKSYDEAKQTIQQLEKSQSSYKKQISQYQSIQTRAELSYQSALYKLEKESNNRYMDMQNITTYPQSDEVQKRKFGFYSFFHRLQHFQNIRGHLKVVLIGSISAVITPFVVGFLTYLGSTTKIISIVEGSGQAAKFVLQFPFLQRVLGGLGGIAKTLRLRVAGIFQFW